MTEHSVVSQYRMADVSSKAVTKRTAIASGWIFLGPDAYPMVAENRLPKGDALSMAQIAGIQGAKQTPNLLPLCHPISLNRAIVEYALRPNEHAIEVFCIADIAERTGVEMEALCGLSTALMTIWDLSKPINAALRIDRIRLLYKSGGKSGVWTHPDGLPNEVNEILDRLK